jgi:threonine/homoserine/homoserine lactone efflux protein
VSDLAPLATAFGFGAALGAAPGPVQVLLLGETTRGGARRGFQAMAGANGTFGLLLFALAAGLSFAEPTGTTLQVIQIAGGLVLLFIAASSLVESIRGSSGEEPTPPRLPPFVRGVLAVLINPGALIFLATSASALIASAADENGRAFGFLTAAAMLLGVMVVDASMVLLAATGTRLLTPRGTLILGVVLSAGLAAIGVWLLVQGVTG